MSADLRIPLDQINSLDNTPEQNNPLPADPAPVNDEHVIDMTAGRDAPEQPIESSFSADGSETVVFKQDVPENAEIDALRNFGRLLSGIFSGAMIASLIFGYLVLDIYNFKVPSFTKIFWYNSVLLSFRVLLHLLGSALPNKAKEQLRLMSDSITTLFVTQVFSSYLSGNLPVDNFHTCLYANVGLQFLKIAIFGLEQNAVESVVRVFESTTALFAGLKLANPTQYSSWGVVLVFYVIIYYICIFLLIACIVWLVVLTCVYLLQNANQNMKLTFLVYFGFVFFTLVIIGLGFFIVEFYYGIYILLNQNAIIPNPGPIASMPEEFYLAGTVLIAVSAVSLVVVAVVNAFFMNMILKQFMPYQGKEISLKTYAAAFVLELKKISGNYFRKNQTTESPAAVIKEEISEMPLDECVVCQAMPSSFVLFPCNHCVVCVECAKPFLESQSNCPVCKETIKKCAHIAFDEEKKRYMVDFSYKLKNY